jgi:hypothetical protein
MNIAATAQTECDRIFEDVVLPTARCLKDAAALVEFIEDQAAHWRDASRGPHALPFAAEIAAFLDDRAAEIFGDAVMGGEADSI